jgi:hypothetical protein
MGSKSQPADTIALPSEEECVATLTLPHFKKCAPMGTSIKFEPYKQVCAFGRCRPGQHFLDKQNNYYVIHGKL